MQLFSGELASQITGAARTQIDYLVRARIVEPTEELSKREGGRRFNLQKVFQIAVAAELLDAKVSVLDVGQSIRTINENWSRLIDHGTRDGVAVLALLRTPGSRLESVRTVNEKLKLRQRPNNEPHLQVAIGPITAFQEAWLIDGTTVRVAVNVAWIMRALEKMSGETFA